MKKIVFLLFILYITFGFSQDFNYKEYSYAQFVELMTTEKDTVFRLENAIIKYDSITDKDFISRNYFSSKGTKDQTKKQRLIVNKTLELENVQFLSEIGIESFIISGLHNLVFKKPVTIYNSFLLYVSNCEFKDKFTLINFEYEKFEAFKKKYPKARGNNELYNSRFSGDIRIIQSSLNFDIDTNRKFGFTLGNNIFDESIVYTTMYLWKLKYVNISDNTFNSLHPYYIQVEEADEARIEKNIFQKGLAELYCIQIDELFFKQNTFNIPSLLNLKVTNNTNFIGGNIFNAPASSLDGFNDYRLNLAKNYADKNWWDFNTIEYFNKYEEQEKIQDLTYYQYELDQKSVFYNYFKERHNTTEANRFYTQIKDLENKRLIYDYGLDPNFNKYFKIQINKFLKLFSNYGTEPERAVIVSLYVILFFALIYLLFPNSWDSHGKKRLMHRFEFFQKYLRRKEGMHTLYLENKKEEISSYEDFKTNLEKAHLELPSFFISWSKPLYNASMFSSRVKARFLKTTDVLQGKWQDLTPKQKRLKNIQIGFLLTLGLFYDLFIKVLNALMLSINTFTTLGFGEIPIKGLPRYLAIIQGFIGWFMLTIFSVSLISQLLN